MRQLQCSLQSDGEGCPYLLRSWIAHVKGARDVWRKRKGRYSTCQGDIAVNEKFEQVIELVGKYIDSTNLGLRSCICKGERQRGLVARREWDILKVSMGICDVFTCISGPDQRKPRF